MDELALVKALTGLTNLDDTIAAFYLSQAEQFILDYCGIDTLPKQLQGVKVQIASKMIQENTTSGGAKGSAGEVKGTVSSLSDGNQSVSYSSGAAASASFTYDQASIVTAFGYILNRYRKLKHDGRICRCIDKDMGIRRPGGNNELDYYTTPNVTRKHCK